MSGAAPGDARQLPPAKKRRLRSPRMANNGAPAPAPAHHSDIDEGLYSRQLYVLGHDAMRRMAKADVLVSGLGGLGLEVAKNLILAGVRSVALHDYDVAPARASASSFCPPVAGEDRAGAALAGLAELNSHVSVRRVVGELRDDVVDKFRVVVSCGQDFRDQLRLGEAARRCGVAFVAADTRGLFAQVFCDFGDEFTVLDPNGEPPVSAMVAGVTRDGDGVVTCLDDSRHGFEDGDRVTFSEVSSVAP